jgi:hypothetical protein
MGIVMFVAVREPFVGSTCRWNGSVLGLLVWCTAMMGCGEEAALQSEQIKATAAAIAPSGGSRTADIPAPPTAQGTSEEAEDAVPTVQPRKIIYNAQIELVVEDLSTVVDDLTGLVKQHGGYVAETDVSGSAGGQRRGMWKVRVPVDRFDAFTAAVTKLGELQKNHVDSQDVTEEFYDIEARIANKQQEEKRLQKHLGDSTGSLEDILAVEREISRVRGEIEQAQGRLRYLANVSALSTVTITASELRDYKPPISPAFSTQIGRTFFNSLELLIDFGKGIVLLVVAGLPWLPVVALLAWPLWRLMRRASSPSPMP